MSAKVRNGIPNTLSKIIPGATRTTKHDVFKIILLNPFIRKISDLTWEHISEIRISEALNRFTEPRGQFSNRFINHLNDRISAWRQPMDPPSSLFCTKILNTQPVSRPVLIYCVLTFIFIRNFSLNQRSHFQQHYFLETETANNCE
ncbi:Uncharacterised protein [Enterobacter cloacae]|nr:Uncharacterised protein [Enterobacter cloacae]